MERKKYKILENVVIEDVGGKGRALARVDGKIIFIPKVVPGDVVDVRVNKDQDNYAVGIPMKLKKSGKIRIEPICQQFGVCGGCHWQNLPYEKQLYYKHKHVIHTFVRKGRFSGFHSNYIIPSQQTYYYRNKLEFTFSKQRWLEKHELELDKNKIDFTGLGFYMPGMYFKLLDIKKCHLQKEPSNAIRLALKEFAAINNIELFDQQQGKGFLRSIIIRNSSSGEWLIMLTFHYHSEEIKVIIDYLIEKFPEIVSAYYVINPNFFDVITNLEAIHHYGNEYITEHLDGLQFRIGPKSFYQVNSNQTVRLYKAALEFANLYGQEVVYDLYTGTGTIALYFARHCKKVVGIEYVSEAVEDARANAALNSIDNTVFYPGDMKNVLNDSLISREGFPDVVVTDPPRAGMHEDVIKTILNAHPKKIIYISCNPVTQVRDIQQMEKDYKLLAIQPVDMFPQTFHVENIALLERK